MKRLRISGLAFRRLISHFDAPPILLAGLLSQDLPSGPCHRFRLSSEGYRVSDWWFTIPTRAVISCTDLQKSHSLSSAGSDQMNPAQYLHLEACRFDIRPSKIVAYFHHDQKSRSMRVVCLDFQDGRWYDIAEEPVSRAREVLRTSVDLKKSDHPFFMHLILLTSAIRWWKVVLDCFNRQLIEFVGTFHGTPSPWTASRSLKGLFDLTGEALTVRSCISCRRLSIRAQRYCPYCGSSRPQIQS